MKRNIIILFSFFSISLFSQINFGHINVILNDGYYNSTIQLTDINNDNLADIFTEFNGRIIYFENNGNSGFNNYTEITDSISEYLSHIQIADINNDNLKDIVAINGGNISCFINISTNNTNILFSNEIIIVDTLPYPAGAYYNIRLTDIDNNGSPDLITNSWDKNIRCYFNDGYGNFSNADTLFTETHYYRLKYYDINSDGFIDILSSNLPKNEITIYLNNGDSTFYNYLTLKIDSNRALTGMEFFDMNNDNYTDIIISASKLSYFDISDTSNIQEVTIFSDSNPLTLYKITDINNNGNIDFVCSQHITFSFPSVNKIYLLINNGNNTYTPIFIDSLNIIGSIYTYDIENDGDADLIINSPIQNTFNKNQKSKSNINGISWIENLLITNLKNVIKTDVQIYPNPVKDRIYLKNINSAYEYSIYDINGKLIDKNISNNNRIENLSRLGSGVYILKIKNKNNIIQTNKFIKL